MSHYTACYYNCEKSVKPYSFYVLCKGKNSGRPMAAPCPNCFVVTCSNETKKDFYFTLCFALWKSKSFHIYLTGSVIEFIRISDFKKLLQEHGHRLQNSNGQFFKTVNQVKAIEQKEVLMKQQLQLLGDLKVAMLRQFLK